MTFLIATIFFGGISTARGESVGVKVKLTSGDLVSGQWAGVTDTAIRLGGDAATQEIKFDQIVSVRPAKPVDAPVGPPINATLIDGTSIRAQDLGMEGAVLTIEPRQQPPINFPVDQIRSIRFRLNSPATDPQWLGLTEKESRSDLMVIRRGNDQLDPIEGVIVGLDLKNLQFELDGDQIEAPLDRLEGVLFRSSPSKNRSVAAVKVSDIYGSTYLVNRLMPSDSGNSIEFMLPGQVKHVVEISEIDVIQWASGQVMLAAESAASSQMDPYLSTNLPADLMKGWFAPMADGQDLIASAGGSVEYRVAKGFQTLAGSVNRDKSVAGGGSVAVRILVDENVRWEQTLTDTSSKGFRIPVANALRVRLEVLAGDDGDVGDQVRFSKPRLLK